MEYAATHEFGRTHTVDRGSAAGRIRDGRRGSQALVTDGPPTSSTYVRPLEEPKSAVTVLCVHPDEPTARAVAEGVTATDRPVDGDWVTTVTELFGRLESEDVDCLVSGLRFPETDGVGLLERVRDTYDELPFVLFTDEGTEAVAAAAVNAGADGYVPYDDDLGPEAFDSLNDRIATVVDTYRSHQRFEETTELLFRLTEYTTDTLWMFTGDWSETVIVNSAYDDIWNRTKADLVDDPTDFLEGIHPDDREMVRDQMAVISGGDPADVEYRALTDDGEETRWLSVHAEPVFDDGEVEYVAGFTRDITELKRREQRLTELAGATRELPHARSEREVTATVVDIVDSIIGCPVTAYWSYDAERDVLEPVQASESALDVADVSAPEELSDIGPEHDEMEIFETGESTVVPDYADLENPSAPHADLQTLMVVPVGNYGLLNLAYADTAEIDEFEHTMIDIIEQSAIDALERVERERELEHRRTELERSNESLQQFAYVASHDLQEPLRMVSSYVSLLEDEYADSFDEEGELYMEYAVDGATRMQEMIDALLQYSRVHTQGEEFTDVATADVLEDTVQSLELLVDEHEATVELGDLPPVNADRTQLGQLFQNLIENAIHYGGSEPTVVVDGERDGERVHFTVADDGPGIDQDQHDRIFEIFKQAATRSGGTGIGLAMCKRIVNRHDGEIWVESAPGDGATFHFTLPTADDDRQERHR